VSTAIGLLETIGLTPTLVAVDVMEKTADVRVLQAELNDFLGVCVKIAGPVDAVRTAIEAGRRTAEQMGGRPVTDVISQLAKPAERAVFSPREFNPLIQQDVVFTAYDSLEQEDRTDRQTSSEESNMSQESPFALGLIETQGFTAVFEAIDTACKAANVEVIGKEKLGGGYVTVIIKGDLSAVTAAIAAGRVKVEGLGKLIAAHVIARPSQSVLNLLPKTP
jgi:microcompartment protein CcmL/EutN